MRLHEITNEQLAEVAPVPPTGPNSNKPKQMQVVKDTNTETQLIDPKTKVKTTVPKDPKKPGNTTTDAAGQVTVNTKQTGTVKPLKSGQKVNVV